jgi:hypothetical protein
MGSGVIWLRFFVINLWCRMRFCECKTHRWILGFDRVLDLVCVVIVAMRFRVARNTSYVYDFDRFIMALLLAFKALKPFHYRSLLKMPEHLGR